MLAPGPKDRSRFLIFLKKKKKKCQTSSVVCFLSKFLNALIGLSVDLKPSCWNQRLLVDSELLLHYSEYGCLGPRDDHKSTSWNIYMKLAGWCNEVSCIFPTTRLCKAPSSSFNVDAFPPWKLLTFSTERISALCVGLPLCVFRELGWNVAALFKPSFLLDGMFYLPRHTMRWWSIPEMLHLLLRSFPAGAESLISAPYLSLESVIFSHKGCLLSRGCFVNVSERFTNGHNSSRC